MCNEKENTLITWIGKSDLLSFRGEKDTIGPTAHILESYKSKMDNLILLHDFKWSKYIDRYITYLKSFNCQEFNDIKTKCAVFKDPFDYDVFYKISKNVINSLDYDNNNYFINTSSGTPLMAVSWFMAFQSKEIPKEVYPKFLCTGFHKNIIEIDFDSLSQGV